MQLGTREPGDGTFQPKDVDAIVLNYRVGRMAARAARSAKENGIKRVVVVDNQSGDDSLSVLEREVSGFAEVLPLTENVGFSSGNNAGAKQGKNPLILFLNADVSLGTGAVQQMVDAMNADPSIGIAAPSLQGPSGEPQASAYFLLSPFRLLNSLLGLDRLGAIVGWGVLVGNADLKRNGNYTGVVESVYGACMLVRRCAFEAVNGFDEEFFLYCEETDLCLRLQNAGWKAYRCGGAQATHWHGQSAQQVARASLILMSESHRLYARKHFSIVGRTVTALAFIVGLNLRVLLARTLKAKMTYLAALGVWLGWTPTADPRHC
jgi:N-acetylglucosaminyl-diphospho-decaprenol L-rhamnosyltransferase